MFTNIKIIRQKWSQIISDERVSSNEAEQYLCDQGGCLEVAQSMHSLYGYS